MRRAAFAILAGLSLLLSLAAAAGWVQSHFRPGFVTLWLDGDDATAGTAAPEVLAAAFAESRDGRLVLLSQWVSVTWLPGDVPKPHVDARLPRSGRVIARIAANDTGRATGRAAFSEYQFLSVARPTWRESNAVVRWLRSINFGYDHANPGPIRVAYHDPGGLGMVDIVRVDGSRNPVGPPLDFLSYRQLILPYWFLVLLGLPVSLLWARANRRSRRWARRGLCPGCGYDVRASPGRCPECGRGGNAVAA